MKHFRCKFCGDISVVRHYHMQHKHKEIKAHNKHLGECKVDTYFEEVERIVGKDWILKR